MTHDTGVDYLTTVFLVPMPQSARRPPERMEAPSSSGQSLKPQVVDVDIRPGGYAIVTLAKEPVNSLDLETWQQLEHALDRLEGDPSVSGVIFASGLKRDVFSAGNDILELYAPKVSLVMIFR